MDSNTFRSAAFGGFNRADVIAYIERTAKESAAQIRQLQEENDRLTKESGDLREQLAAAGSAQEELSSSLQMESDSLAAAEETLASLRTEAETLRTELAALRGERDRLSAESEALRAQLGGYDSVKSHIADIELAARARADALEAETRERMGDVLEACRVQFEQTISALSSACANVSRQLTLSNESIAALPAAFDALRERLSDPDRDGEN